MIDREILIINKDGDVIFKGKIKSLPIKEELIIERSIELFNDDSPCFIHRSAIMKRIFVEAEDFLENESRCGRNEWMLEALPHSIQKIFHIKENVQKIQYL